MLRVSDLSIRYDRSILEHVSFSLNAGEVVGIVGANGGGKSSLLRVMSGFQDANEGEVSWNDRIVRGPAYNLVPGHPDIQLVNQDFHLDLFHTVYENVMHGMMYLPNEMRETFTEELLELVDLKHLELEQARSLSGGEKQRLAIARALASEPDVLLLDEPFSHLDAHLKLKIGTYLQELARIRKILVILVSHEGREIMEWCGKVLFLNNGNIERTGTPEQFYYEPSSEYEARFFGEINALKQDGKELLFRPTEYRKNKTLGQKVELVATQFCGIFYRNVVKVSPKNQWVLYSSKPFSEISYIQIIAKAGKRK